MSRSKLLTFVLLLVTVVGVAGETPAEEDEGITHEGGATLITGDTTPATDGVGETSPNPDAATGEKETETTPSDTDGDKDGKTLVAENTTAPGEAETETTPSDEDGDKDGETLVAENTTAPGEAETETTPSDEDRDTMTSEQLNSTTEHETTGTEKPTELTDLLTYRPSDEVDTVEEVENGGDPFVKPGGHKKGFRHAKAHDGFHNLAREKHWRHWNDAFTTTPNPSD